MKPLSAQGVPFTARSWYGLYGPKGMPPSLVNRINALLNQWTSLPETIKFLEDKQNQPKGLKLSPSEFAALIQRDLVAWGELIEAAGVTPS